MPVLRSSTTSTRWPSARSRSTRVEPTKPAPPVTSDVHPASWGIRSLVSRASGSMSMWSPMTVRSSSSAPARMMAPGPDDRPVDAGAGLDGGAVEDHGLGEGDLFTDGGAGADDRALDVGALGHRCASGWIGRSVVVEEVEVGLQVGLGRAGVDPVGIAVEGVEASTTRPWSGNVSRSTDTRRPTGMRPSTLGSNT